MADETIVTESVQNTESPTESENTNESLLNGVVEEPKTEDPAPEETPQEEVDYSGFELPEGVTLDEGLLEKAKPLFKDLKLSKEQAQKIVTLQAEAVAESNKQQIATWDNQVKQWKDDTIKALGANYKEELGKANQLIKGFDDESKSFALLLEDSGLANHPTVAKFLINVQKAIGEDTFHKGASAGPARTLNERLSDLYPSMNEMGK